MAAVAEAKVLRWTPHPVWQVPTREQWLGLVAAHGAEAAGERLREVWRAREEQIRQEKLDPLHFGYEPEVFQQARALLEKYDELYLLGGNREGKTTFAAKYVVGDLAERPDRIWACFHSSEQSSIRQQQAKLHETLPPKWRSIGKLGDTIYVKYTKQNGFSGGQFILPNGSVCMFFNYKQDPDVLEGYELDGAWFDELVPLEFVETMAFRLGKGRRLKKLVTFTPKNGFIPVVGRALAGAKVVATRPAPLLPAGVRHVAGCPPGHMPSVMTGTNHAVLFFHLGQNPFGAAAEVTRELADKPVKMIKERAYGWADRTVTNAFPKYGADHQISRAAFAKEAAAGGTRYCVADPGGTKNWFIKWYFCTAAGHVIVYREWPDQQRYGEWALPPLKVTAFDWRAGEAQRLTAGRGMGDYRKLILELEGWVWDEKLGVWDGRRAEKIQARLIDPRMGGMGVPGQEEGTSIIELMAVPVRDRAGRTTVPAMHWEEAASSHIQESVQLLQDAMDYDPDAPVTVENCPKWYVVDDLLQSDLAYREFTGLGGQKDSLKDIIDPDRYFIKTGYGHVKAEMYRVKNGFYY